ncbi:hypothetical protein [Streptomyces sp. NPDC004296]|uniref:hypothetical protein n=1 Tax=Streptomyces sp. NPDC004296 TaxID=3364697 RepID=UPI0036A79AD4
MSRLSLLVTRAQTSPVAASALEQLVTAMRAAGLPDRTVADAPMVLFSFLDGHLLARTSGGPDGAGAVPACDATTYPAMAALTPLMADFGSLTEFDRMTGGRTPHLRADGGLLSQCRSSPG